MSTTTNRDSLLWQLRALMPRRPLHRHEAMTLAELQANRLLRLGGVDEPGTPSELISALPWLRVELRSDLPVSGSAQWLRPRWLVLLNATEPLVRQRFSLMHEFKHVLDHDLADRLYGGRGADAERRAELAADYFAACLLMPKRLVKRLWGQGTQELSELAGAFGVSEVAMRYRLQQLNLTERFARCELRSLDRSRPVRVYWRSTRPLLVAA